MRPGADTKDSRATACGMVAVSFTTKTEGITRATGATTRWTASVGSTTRAANWLTRVTGRRTSSMAQERSTTTIQSHLMSPSTIPTSNCSRITGNTMRACWSMTPRRVEGASGFRMERSSRVISTMTASKASESFTTERGR